VTADLDLGAALDTLTAMPGLEDPDRPVVMRCVFAMGDPPDEPYGKYLAAVDLEAQRRDVWAVATWTADKAGAMVFPTFREAFECWRQVSPHWPVRGDGKPNRPLTLWSVTWENT